LFVKPLVAMPGGMTAQPPLRAAVIPVTPLQQNCTLIWCTATMRAALIDPGGDLPRLKAALAQAGVTLEKILVTHGHIDHCGGAGILAQELGVPIEGPHEEDRFWISRLDEDGRAYGIEGRPFEPDRWLDEGDQVTVGDLTVDVLHCPGHTPGHVIFYHAASRFAQVGDVLFQGSIGRTDFPRGSPGADRIGDHQTVAARRRRGVRLRPRADVDLRARTGAQPVRRRPRAGRQFR
jgi:hydroxyacylglutathione hydrolase